VIEAEPLERQRDEQGVTGAGAEIVEIHHRSAARSEQHPIAFALRLDAVKLQVVQEGPQEGSNALLRVRLRRAQGDPAFPQRLDQ